MSQLNSRGFPVFPGGIPNSSIFRRRRQPADLTDDGRVNELLKKWNEVGVRHFLFHLTPPHFTAY